MVSAGLRICNEPMSINRLLKYLTETPYEQATAGIIW